MSHNFLTKTIFNLINLITLSLLTGTLNAQRYSVSIEEYPNLVKADQRLILKTGYLVVPENRSRPAGRKVKLPFFFVRRADQDARKNVSVYMTGGPGYSTTMGIDSIGYDSSLLKYGGFIALDQRGTKRAKPSLECKEVYEAIRQAYREGKAQDSLVLRAVKQCRENLIQQGVDLSAYNTAESVEDINDLRLALKLDSLNLIGISYSGGLMLSMAAKHPEGVRTLILNSPLPGFISYEETALSNINEALEQVFSNCETDLLCKKSYGNIRERFHTYFKEIGNQKFNLNYWDKAMNDTVKINYGKQELLDIIVGRLNSAQVGSVPFIIDELINGRHTDYVREVVDGYFSGNASISLAMRYSVYCSDQLAYANPKLEKDKEFLFPWLAGYRFNNVNRQICNCWKVDPIAEKYKNGTYLQVPALISAGDIDPWCRPWFNKVIKSYLPNTQLIILHNKGHGPGFKSGNINYLDAFMKDPYNLNVSGSGQ